MAASPLCVTTRPLRWETQWVPPSPLLPSVPGLGGLICVLSQIRPPFNSGLWGSLPESPALSAHPPSWEATQATGRGVRGLCTGPQTPSLFVATCPFVGHSHLLIAPPP